MGSRVMIEQSKVAIWFGGRYRVSQLRETASHINWWVAPLFHGKLKVNPTVGPWGWAMNARTKNPEATWTFMEFLAGRRGQEILAKHGWNLAPFKSVAEAALKDPNRSKEDVEIDQIYLSEAAYLRPPYVNPFITTDEFDSRVSKAVDKMLYLKMPVKKALDEATRKINEIMQRKMKRLGVKASG